MGSRGILPAARWGGVVGVAAGWVSLVFGLWPFLDLLLVYLRCPCAGQHSLFFAAAKKSKQKKAGSNRQPVGVRLAGEPVWVRDETISRTSRARDQAVIRSSVALRAPPLGITPSLPENCVGILSIFRPCGLVARRAAFFGGCGSASVALSGEYGPRLHQCLDFPGRPIHDARRAEWDE
jgi:hypothetical protein